MKNYKKYVLTTSQRKVTLLTVSRIVEEVEIAIQI